MSAPDAKVKSIFVQAFELSGNDRSEFLTRTCSGDTALRERVDALLKAAEDPHPFLREPSLAAPQPPDPATTPDAVIGPYRLLEPIGEGGFGSVFLAEQKEPVRRRVAIKILRVGMDTRQFVARFEQERQALAVMDHPNVAKVFDAGATPTGRPYFVMEYVSGQPITTYCDAASLSVRDRIELFLQVCAAVQHAHTKGIIHRDLKPANVIVSAHDGKPTAKVIDFGIAKAIDRPFTDKTVFTEQRQLVGTPEYMSPEQAEGSRDIDTRTDVYSLGVLLYELLSGVPPFDPEKLRSAAYAELQRLIRDVDPPRPSTRVSQQGDAQSVAHRRGTEPARLGTLLRGELDWIIMHAMEKERGRRYESPSAFASDLTRYLAGEAVQVAPPSVAYRVRKFASRNRALVASAAGVCAVLVMALIMAFNYARSQRNIATAQMQLSAAAEQAKNDAEAHQRQLEQVSRFQQSQLKLINVEQMGQKLRDDIVSRSQTALTRARKTPEEIESAQQSLSAQLKELNFTDVAVNVLDTSIFDPSLKAVDADFKDQPDVQASLLLTIAQTMEELGMYERALDPQMRGLALTRKIYGDDAVETVDTIGHTGTLLKELGKYGEAEALYREAYERSKRTRGEDDDRTLSCVNNLALILQQQDKLAEAEPLYKLQLSSRERISGPNSPTLIPALNNMGYLLVSQGKLAAAEPYLRSALQKQRLQSDAKETDTLTMMTNLAAVLEKQGEFEEAEPLLREVVDTRRRIRGETHAETLRAINGLAVLLQDRGKFDEAEKLFKESLEGYRKSLKPDHPQVLWALRALGSFYRSRDRQDEAEPYLREALEGTARAFGPETKEAGLAQYEMGLFFLDKKDYLAAEKLFASAIFTLQKLPGMEWECGISHTGLGQCFLLQQKFPDAERELVAAQAILAAAEGTPAEHYRHCLVGLRKLYQDWNKAEPTPERAAKYEEWKAKVAALKKK